MIRQPTRPARWISAVRFVTLMSGLSLVALLLVPSLANASESPVTLGASGPYSVLGGQTVTNTGPTNLSGDLGVSPGTAFTGFPPGIIGGATNAGDATAGKAQADLTIAYDDAAGRTPTASMAGDLVGQTLTTGVYKSTSSIALSGTLTLDGQGDPNAVFIFQVVSTLVTASSSKVSMINGADACNVYWQIGSSATLGTTSSFVGTIMALTDITVTTDTVVAGRALARNGSVTLDSNTFLSPACTATTTTTAGGATTTAGDTTTTSGGATTTLGATTTTAGGATTTTAAGAGTTTTTTGGTTTTIGATTTTALGATTTTNASIPGVTTTTSATQPTTTTTLLTPALGTTTTSTTTRPNAAGATTTTLGLGGGATSTTSTTARSTATATTTTTTSSEITGRIALAVTGPNHLLRALLLSVALLFIVGVLLLLMAPPGEPVRRR
ncbi:MAG: hypothetical protein QOG44_139 [Acidimicrobiaceae bacterium]|nr:hypothetical protein [Acidimicrobiaceae bacterium]